MIKKYFIILLLISIGCNQSKNDTYKEERIAFFNDILADTSQFQKPVYISKNGYFTKFEGFKSIESGDEDLSFDNLTRNQFLACLFKVKDTLLFEEQWKEKFEITTLQSDSIKILDLDYTQLEKSRLNFKNKEGKIIPIYTFVKPYFNSNKTKAFLQVKFFGTELWNLYEKENNKWIYKKRLSILMYD